MDNKEQLEVLYALAEQLDDTQDIIRSVLSTTPDIVSARRLAKIRNELGKWLVEATKDLPLH